MTTFPEAYAIHGPDVEAIAKLLGIAPAEADKQINAELDKRYEERRAAKLSYGREYYRRRRDELREIRARCSA